MEQKKKELFRVQNGKQHEVLSCLKLHSKVEKRIVNSKLRRAGRGKCAIEVSFTGLLPDLAEFIYSSPSGSSTVFVIL